MTCYDISRTVHAVENPNAAKPTLSLGFCESERRKAYAKPWLLRKAGTVKQTGSEVDASVARDHNGCDPISGFLGKDRGLDIHRAGDDKIEFSADKPGSRSEQVEILPPSKPLPKLPSASSLLGAASASPPRLVVRSDSLARTPLPFVAINTGAVYPGEPSWTEISDPVQDRAFCLELSQ